MIEAIAWVGSALIIWALLQGGIRMLRWAGLAVAVGLVVVNAIIGVESMVLIGIVLVAVCAFQLGGGRPFGGDRGRSTVVSLREELVELGEELRPGGL